VIRINLLPIRKVKRAEASQRQFVYMGMAILATVVGVVFLHCRRTGSLKTSGARTPSSRRRWPA